MITNCIFEGPINRSVTVLCIGNHQGRSSSSCSSQSIKEEEGGRREREREPELMES